MKIYVASSRRNKYQPDVIKLLESNGYDHYDFRNPEEGNKGFKWSDIDLLWKGWTMSQYKNALDHPIAINGFGLDFEAMKKCDTFLGVMPFGRSASMEMGWAAGQNKNTILLLSDAEPELMVKIFDYVCVNMLEVLEILFNINQRSTIN